jgi:3-keto-5-aminohexanoate cleavage enzyme
LFYYQQYDKDSILIFNALAFLMMLHHLCTGQECFIFRRLDMQKLIITVALTGNVPTREMNTNLPVTPEEIAKDVARCADAGASLFHVHARDILQKPTLNPSVFMEIVQHIKSVSPEVIVQLSTGGRAGKNWEDRANPIKLLPEMGSFTTGSTNLPGMIYENSPQFIEFLATVYHQTQVKPEIEVFEAGMMTNALFLQNKGLLTPPLHFNFVLGAPGAMSGSARNLVFLVDGIPQGSTWTATGIGKSEIPLAAIAIAMGGHVRVGLEDNLYMPDGLPASNARLVETVTAIAREIGREIASPDEARTILSLNPAWKNRIILSTFPSNRA